MLESTKQGQPHFAIYATQTNSRSDRGWRNPIFRSIATTMPIGGDHDCLGDAGGWFVSSLTRIPLKKNGSPLRSVFRIGLDALRQILLSGCAGRLVLDDVIPLLSNSKPVAKAIFN